MMLFFAALALTIARLFLGLHRYFDPDEFAHLHWAYLLTQGNLPYKDFFLYHIPLFQLTLLPLFFFPPNPSMLLLARLLMCFFYIVVLFLLYIFAKKITNSRTTSLLTIVIMLMFPMTLDKTIEIRPDMLMTLFFLLTVLILTEKMSQKKLFLAGLFYGLSVMAFPKILFTAPAVTALYFWQDNKFNWKKLCVNISAALAGASLPFLLFLLPLVFRGIIPQAIDAIFHSAVTVSEGKSPFSPLLALSPYPFVYVNAGGVSWPWIMNTAIWISALVGLAIVWKNNKKYATFLYLFFLGGITFLFLFPAPYLQYFIPLSVFASLLAAVSVASLGEVFEKLLLRLRFKGAWIKQSFIAVVFMVILFLLSFRQQYQERIAASASNAEQLGVIRDILAISKPTDTVYDMVGSYVFRPDGYFICCHPYYEFADKLTNVPPALSTSLMDHETKFIILDRSGQSLWKPLPDDLEFLLTNYLPSKYPKIYTLGAKFKCTNGVCNQIALDNTTRPATGTPTFVALAGDKYQIITEPANREITIDSNAAGGLVTLAKGLHSVQVPPDITSLAIQLDR